MDIENSINQINELRDAVLEHINTHRYKADLIKNLSNWNQIISSIYMIGDTLEAINSFSISEFPEDSGLKYIYTYGLLQSLFLQQDALRHLHESFDFPFNLSQCLLGIRDIRNASVGHPTKQNKKGENFHNYIDRSSISKSGFEFLRCSNKNNLVEKVSFTEIIRDQLTELIKSYKFLTEKLEEIDQMHKEKFKNSRIQDILSSGLDYFIEKIGNGIKPTSDEKRNFAMRCVHKMKESYIKYKSALEERNELDEYTENDIKTYIYALDKINEYFENSGDMIEEDANIYWSYIRGEHFRFVKLAKEIDEQYEQNT